MEYACQELKLPTAIEVAGSGIEHQINFNDKLNKSLIALSVKTNQLSKSVDNDVLDYDNVVIENNKQDAKKSYKKTKAYHPGFAFIGRLAVHIENRNGNTPAKFRQYEVLKSCLDNLEEAGIKIDKFRGDCASYQEEVIKLLSERVGSLFIRHMNSAGFYTLCGEIENWETIEINFEKKQVATLKYKPFKGEKEYRVVVTRVLTKDKQADLFSGKAYNYYGIITNNEQLTDKEVIEFYNGRGDAENSNRYFLNDFNAHRLPFPDLDTNTVFLYFMAMSSILFEWTKLILVKNKTKTIKLNMRVKAVFFNYIALASTFIKHSRESILKVFTTSTNYKILQI